MRSSEEMEELTSGFEDSSNYLRDELLKIETFGDVLKENDRAEITNGLDLSERLNIAGSSEESISVPSGKFISCRGSVPYNTDNSFTYDGDYIGFEIATMPTYATFHYEENPQKITDQLIATGIKTIKRELGLNYAVLKEYGELDNDERVQLDIGRCICIRGDKPEKLRVGYVLAINVFIYAVKK
jgi:hypothetical protein